jgi:bifunctional pyridoxal-dependent enzyme with beta-cystathionase and maltose regulon repressor activities
MSDQPVKQGTSGCCRGDFVRSNYITVIENYADPSVSLLNFPSSLADQIATSLLRNDKFVKEYMATNRRRLSESYLFATNFLRQHDVPYLESNAAFFIWVNLSAAIQGDTTTDQEILSRLRNEKVYIAIGTAYASEEAGWFRLVFAHPANVLEEGLNRMLRALKA